MAELTTREIIVQIRDRAKCYSEIANLIEKQINPEPGSPRIGSVTAIELEDAVREKSGRARNFADRFNVEESAIWDLIKSPESKVFMAERGWLKLKEDATRQ